MKKTGMNYKHIFLGLCLLMSSTISFSQTNEVGAMAGISLYNGQLSKTPFVFDEAKPMGSIFGKLGVSSQFGLQGSLSMGKISGTDANKKTSYVRNLSFESNIFEVAFTGAYDIFDLDYSKVSPYVYAGFAVFHHNPKAEVNGQMVELQPLGTEGQGLPGYEDKYSLWQVSVPMGLGVKYKVNDQFIVRADFGSRMALTSYLDDVGAKEYAKPSDLIKNGQTALDAAYKMDEIEGGLPYASLEDDELRSKILRSSTDRNDWYYLTGVGVSYVIDTGRNAKIKRNRRGVPYGY